MVIVSEGKKKKVGSWELREEEIEMFVSFYHICLHLFCVYMLVGRGLARGELAGVSPLFLSTWVLRMELQQSGLAASSLSTLSHLTVSKTSAKNKTHIQNRHWSELQCL